MAILAVLLWTSVTPDWEHSFMALVHEDFAWCIRVIRRYFRLGGQDIFRQTFRRSRWFYVLTAIWITSFAFHVMVVINFDGFIQIMNVVFVIGGGQVNYGLSKNSACGGRRLLVKMLRFWFDKMTNSSVLWSIQINQFNVNSEAIRTVCNAGGALITVSSHSHLMNRTKSISSET